MKIKILYEQMGKKQRKRNLIRITNDENVCVCVCVCVCVFVYCWSNHLFEEEWNIIQNECEMFFDRGGYRLCLFCMLYT